MEQGGTSESHPWSHIEGITLVGQDLLLHLHLQPDPVTCSGFWEGAGKALKAELGQREGCKIIPVKLNKKNHPDFFGGSFPGCPLDRCKIGTFEGRCSGFCRALEHFFFPLQNGQALG